MISHRDLTGKVVMGIENLRCELCGEWTLARQTRYEDGSIVNNYKPPDGTGHCEVLNLDTAPEFFCAKFKMAGDGFTHIYTTEKSGAPWQHSHYVPCPDCSANGMVNGTGCHRCAAGGKVLLYDDGYLGEEQHRIHPRERELARKPTCLNCGKEVERDWVACPKCGHRTQAMAKTEIIRDIDAGLPGPAENRENGI